jgi:RES domain-containing protein
VTPLPPPLGDGEIRLWRIDAERRAESWSVGEGSFRVGGRWNTAGVRVVYASLDPATATIEVAVHKGFRALDIEPHVLTSARIADPSLIHVVRPEDVPNPNWLNPGTPNRNQQAFGDALLGAHRLILIPSAAARYSWNLIFEATQNSENLSDIVQVRFALDLRLQA